MGDHQECSTGDNLPPLLHSVPRHTHGIFASGMFHTGNCCSMCLMQDLDTFFRDLIWRGWCNHSGPCHPQLSDILEEYAQRKTGTSPASSGPSGGWKSWKPWLLKQVDQSLTQPALLLLRGLGEVTLILSTQSPPWSSNHRCPAQCRTISGAKGSSIHIKGGQSTSGWLQ